MIFRDDIIVYAEAGRPAAARARAGDRRRARARHGRGAPRASPQAESKGEGPPGAALMRRGDAGDAAHGRAVSVALLLAPRFPADRRRRAAQARDAASTRRSGRASSASSISCCFPALLFRSLARVAARASATAGAAGRRRPRVHAGRHGAVGAARDRCCGLPQPTFAACFQCGFRFNTYIALAAASRVAGEAGIALISLLVGVLVPVVNVAAVAMLARGARQRVLRSSPATRWCSPVLPASRGSSPACRCPISPITSSGCWPARRCRSACSRSAPGYVSRAARCRCRPLVWWNGVKLVGAAGDRLRARPARSGFSPRSARPRCCWRPCRRRRRRTSSRCR